MTYSWCGAWCGAEVVDLVGLGGETDRRGARGCELPLSLGVKNSPHPQLSHPQPQQPLHPRLTSIALCLWLSCVPLGLLR